MAKQQAYGFEAHKQGVPPMGHAISTTDEASSKTHQGEASDC